MAIYKKLLAKNGSKTVEKNMAPYKNHSGENKLNQGKKCALYKNDSGQKNRSQTVEDKKWHLIKMTVAKINEPHRAR